MKIDFSNLNSNQLRIYGNILFDVRKYVEAIKCYSLALSLEPNNSTLYSNRALCYMKIDDFNNVLQDCNEALKRDPGNAKAMFYVGDVLSRNEDYTSAINTYEEVLAIVQKKHLNFGDDVTAAIRRNKKLLHEVKENHDRSQKMRLKKMLEKLIRRVDYEDKGSLQDLALDQEADLQEMNKVFHELEEIRKDRTVPEVFQGRINFEIMRDPVITPCGITYERESILSHLHQVGHFDPITRKPLTDDQLISNLAMKEIIDSFLDKNPWAIDY